MSIDKVLRAVWKNREGARYVPMATNPGVSSSWRVWDRKDGRFLEDAEVRSIDPSEPFLAIH